MSEIRFRCVSDPPSGPSLRNTRAVEKTTVRLWIYRVANTIGARPVFAMYRYTTGITFEKKSRFAEVNVARENNGTLVNVQLSRVTTATKLRRKLLSPPAHYNEYASKNHRPYRIRSTKHNPYTPVTKRQPYNELFRKRQMPPWSVTIGRTLGFITNT